MEARRRGKGGCVLSTIPRLARKKEKGKPPQSLRAVQGNKKKKGENSAGNLLLSAISKGGKKAAKLSHSHSREQECYSQINATPISSPRRKRKKKGLDPNSKIERDKQLRKTPPLKQCLSKKKKRRTLDCLLRAADKKESENSSPVKLLPLGL